MMKEIRQATLALFGVTLLWGGTFVWMQQSLDAAAASSPELSEKDVLFVRFYVLHE